MKNDLTSSHIDRQNILNNKYALEPIQTEFGINEFRRWATHHLGTFTMAQVASPINSKSKDLQSSRLT